MKKLVFSLAVAVMALLVTSCSQQEDLSANQVEVKKGIPVKLTVSIGGTDTRIAYTDKDNALKGVWNPGDKVTVVTLDNSNNLLTKDDFTYNGTEDARTATFEGTFSGVAGNTIRVFYPALTESYIEEGKTNFRSPASNSREKSNHFYEVTTGSPYMRWNYIGLNQLTSGSTAHLNDAPLAGNATYSEAEGLKATLEHQLYVIKVTAQLPESIANVKRMKIVSYAAEGSSFNLIDANWAYLSEYFPMKGASSTVDLYFGGWEDEGNLTAKGITIPDDKKVVAYVLTLADYDSESLLPNSKIKVCFYINDSTFYIGEKVLVNTFKPERGKLYTLDVTVDEAVQSE